MDPPVPELLNGSSSSGTAEWILQFRNCWMDCHCNERSYRRIDF